MMSQTDFLLSSYLKQMIDGRLPRRLLQCLSTISFFSAFPNSFPFAFRIIT